MEQNFACRGPVYFFLKFYSYGYKDKEAFMVKPKKNPGAINEETLAEAQVHAHTHKRTARHTQLQYSN